jgi:hypothetical protein
MLRRMGAKKRAGFGCYAPYATSRDDLERDLEAPRPK